MADWPTTLPGQMNLRGFRDTTDPKGMLRTTMDQGPDKRRTRSTLPIHQFSGQMLLTSAQQVTLDQFYNQTLGQGALSFNWIDPSDCVTPMVLSFATPPSYTYAGKGLVFGTLNLEEVPGA